jgi:outer membrane protein assembly factor BamB
MDVETGVVVIDLGLERGEPETYGTPQRSTVPSWLPSAVLAVLVLLCAAASAAPQPSPLSTVFTLQAGPADAYALTPNGELLAQTFGTLASYDLGTGRMRWQTQQSTPSYRLRTGDGLVLLRPYTNGRDPGTIAISIATGSARWRHPGNVVTIAGSTALLAVNGVRSVIGAGRRVQDSVDAVDPLTGNDRWSVRVPSTAVLIGVPGSLDDGGRMLLVHDDRTADLHDLHTGKVLVSAKLPAADYGPDDPVVAGGLLLLRHPGATGMELSAYDPLTLRQLWTEPADGAYGIQPCGRLVCLIAADALRAVDPATGDERWSRPRWQTIEQRGTMFVAYTSSDTSEPVGLIDPDTGRTLTDLSGWRMVGGEGAGDHLLVTRAVAAGARSMVAVARPGDPQPRPLAELPAGTGDCQAVPARLVCRSMYGELVVWAYRQKG